jgi:hypothetical protein
MSQIEKNGDKMSAFMVDKDHIDFLVQAAIAGATDSRGWEGPHGGFSFWNPVTEVRVSIDPHAQTVRCEGAFREVISPSELGQRLLDTNLKSIHARYPDTVEDPEHTPGPRERYWETPYVFEPIDTGRTVYSIGAGLRPAVLPVAETVAVAAQVKHYEYQSCEHKDWHGSEAQAFCEGMREHLLDSLPGRESVSWGYTRAA